MENADGQSVLLFFQVIQAVIQLVNGNTNGTFLVRDWRALGFAPLHFLSYFWSCDLFLYMQASRTSLVCSGPSTLHA